MKKLFLSLVLLLLFCNKGDSIFYILNPAALDDPFKKFGFLIMGSDTSPGQVIKAKPLENSKIAGITLGAGLVRLGGATGSPSDSIDKANDFSYFGTFANPANIVKVNNDTLATSTLAIPAPALFFERSVIDETNGFLYAVTRDSAPRYMTIHKIDLSSFTITGTASCGVSVCGSAQRSGSIIFDQANGFIYIGLETTGSVQAPIAKFNTTPSLIDSITVTNLPAGADLYGAVLDTDNNLAYFAGNQSPEQIIEVDLDTFTLTGKTVTTSVNRSLLGIVMVIDPDFEYLYYASNDTVSKINKSTLTEESTIDISASGFGTITSGIIDTKGYYFYLAVQGSPTEIININLLQFTLDTSAIQLESSDPDIDTMVFDDEI